MAKAKGTKANGNGKALVKFDAELAALAQQATETESGVGGGNIISTRNGQFTYKGATIPGGEFNAVIIDHVLLNRYFGEGFDPDNMTAPDCYAFGRDNDEMAPHENASNPQNETCTGCQQNEWGTADRGNGKACANIRRLALLSEEDLNNGEIENGEIAYIHIPVTSVRNWAGYVRKVKQQLNRPPLAVITKLKITPDPKTQFSITFELADQITDADALTALLQKYNAVKEEITFPYQQMVKEIKPARSAKGKNQKSKKEPRASSVPPVVAAKGFGAAKGKAAKASKF